MGKDDMVVEYMGVEDEINHTDYLKQSQVTFAIHNSWNFDTLFNPASPIQPIDNDLRLFFNSEIHVITASY